MNKPLDSGAIKSGLFNYAVRTWHPLLIIDEVSVNRGFADIFVLKQNMQSIEIEIKVSLSDLTCNELKKHKYNMEFWKRNPRYEHITNYFYFTVPNNLKDKSLAFINDNIPFAGLITCININSLRVVKRAKKLHDRNMTTEKFMEYQSIQARKYAWIKSTQMGLKL